MQESGVGIDKLYTQIVKVFRLCMRIEPFAALLWVLGIYTRAYTETVDPACQPSIPQQRY